MRLMFDTNVIADVLLRREPFYGDSYLALLNCIENGDWCSFPVSATSDVFYLIRKVDNPKEKLKYVKNIFNEIADVLSEDFDRALELPMKDFEDALLACVAKRNKVDYIITRNIKDFKNSPVTAITPEEFNKR